MLASIWNNQDSFSCSNQNCTFSNFFFIALDFDAYFTILYHVTKYLAIYNNWKQIATCLIASMIYIYIYIGQNLGTIP